MSKSSCHCIRDPNIARIFVRPDRRCLIHDCEAAYIHNALAAKASSSVDREQGFVEAAVDAHHQKVGDHGLVPYNIRNHCLSLVRVLGFLDAHTATQLDSTRVEGRCHAAQREDRLEGKNLCCFIMSVYFVHHSSFCFVACVEDSQMSF